MEVNRALDANSRSSPNPVALARATVPGRNPPLARRTPLGLSPLGRPHQKIHRLALTRRICRHARQPPRRLRFLRPRRSQRPDRRPLRLLQSRAGSHHQKAGDRNGHRPARHPAPRARRSPADALRHSARSRVPLAVFPVARPPIHAAAARRIPPHRQTNFRRPAPGTLERSRLRTRRAPDPAGLRQSRRRRNQRPIPHRSRRNEIPPQHRAAARLRAIPARSQLPRPPRHRRPPRRHDSHFHRRRRRRPYHPTLRDARPPRKWNWPRADGKFHSGATPPRLQIRLAHRHQHQFFRRPPLRTPRLPHHKKIRRRRLERRLNRGAHFLIARSFSSPFSSSMNSFTSLKSRYTLANRTYATLSNFFSLPMMCSPISLVVRSRSGASLTNASVSSTIASSFATGTGRFSHAFSSPCNNLWRSNFSRRPSFLITM